MTSLALNIAKVLPLLPVRINAARSERGNITIVDRHNRTFCRVPFNTVRDGEAGKATDHSRAVMIVNTINALASLPDA